MDKEQLEKRLAELRKQLEQIQANGNALIGAISECEHWLAALDQPIQETDAAKSKK